MKRTEKDFSNNLLNRLLEKEKAISIKISHYRKEIEKSKKDYYDYYKVGSAVRNVEEDETTIRELQLQRYCLEDVIDAVREALDDTNNS